MTRFRLSPSLTDGQLRVAALTQGKYVPSTRFRVLQHIEPLAQQGIAVEHLPAGHGAYPPPGTLPRLAWLPAALADAALRVRQSSAADLRLLQRELISTLLTAEPWLKDPFVLDVDDAVFLHRRGHMTDRIARRAALTICGNAYLAQHYGEFGPVEILPTAVDTDRFVPAAPPSRPTIGWSGSSSGLPYLESIEEALRVVLERHPDAILHVVADAQPRLAGLPAHRVCFERWRPDTEVNALQRFSVGLMPLADDAWARGKCSFKMLTYMAVGIPVVVSPVGMNAEVLALSACGIAASRRDDWIDALDLLLSDGTQSARYGRAGRETVVRHYSRGVIAPRLARLLHGVSERTK